MCTMTIPATQTKSIGLPADAQLLGFLHHHQVNFTWTGQLLPVKRDTYVRMFYRDGTKPAHLPFRFTTD
jgi:hypothetical protein